MKNKSDIIARISDQTGHTKTIVENILDSLQEIVTESVQSGEIVRITGFLMFVPVIRNARTMVNPKNNTVCRIDERNAVRIKPLKRFKDAINDSYKNSERV